MRSMIFGTAAVTLLAWCVFGQPVTDSNLDPTTGRPPGEPEASRVAESIDLPAITKRLEATSEASLGGELIGYTTDNVIPHILELTDLVEATNDLINDGHTLVAVDSLTPGDLAGLDRLVVGIVGADEALSSAQVDVIEDFVLGGGKLVFLGENNNFFRDNNVAVGGRFGIEYPPPGGDPDQNVITDIENHPITQGPFGTVSVIDGSGNNPTFYGSMSSPGPNGISIANFDNGFSAAVVIEPDGHVPGSGLVVAFAEINTWTNNGYFTGDNRALWRNTFAYCPQPGGPAGVSLDIKPGSCPNPLNRGSNGVIPVGLLGSEDFDVEEVNIATLLISRADDIGGSAPPNEGPLGPHTTVEDVGTPFDGELCDCHELEADGVLDLSMKFRTAEVVEALELNDLPNGEVVELVVSGSLLDGTPFEASDCVRLVPSG